MTEAVTGVIALDNTLVVTRHFGGLPDEVVVIEVEPGVQSSARRSATRWARASTRLRPGDDHGDRPAGGRAAPGTRSSARVPRARAPRMKADLLEEVQRLIDALESHPDPTVRADVTAPPSRIDAVHRTALTHLVSAIHSWRATPSSIGSPPIPRSACS